MIDLHSHTTASDGQHAPRELVAMAHAAGVTTLAVTDHDTVAGLPEAMDEARQRGLTLVPGIELSAFHRNREVHILGHFLRPDDARLAGFSAMLRTERHDRMVRMVEKMRGLGFPVSMEEVLAIAGDAQLGRPHLARLLVEKNYCADVREAFDRFLGAGQSAFVERYKLDSKEAIELIRGAGGVATVAHPGVSKMEQPDLREMKALGLEGVEVHHSDQNPSIREKYLGIAKDLDLVPTAGSDFHGEKIAPGRRLGTAAMDAGSFAALQARAAS
jgi:predicted metal-dependent phosphoesterase TrpH